MASLLTHRDFQSAQKLPFCYLCGKAFVSGEVPDRDHVPPKSVFAVEDRKPLLLATHRNCNGAFKKLDEKIGQLIGLKRGYVPSAVANRRLKFVIFPENDRGAVTNVNVHEAIWRWIRGFHAGLYREPLTKDVRGALTTPFPKAAVSGRSYRLERLKPQHRLIVETIKVNRLKRNIDRLECNKGKLVYECVWCQSDTGPWMCFFALDLYGWKDLGRTKGIPARGCAGFYVPPSQTLPATATRAVASSIIIPNLDPLDPFGP